MNAERQRHQLGTITRDDDAALVVVSCACGWTHSVGWDSDAARRIADAYRLHSRYGR